MDVTCERCNTEYEFDDALVSERGTTVKCTNCGHQFKVRRAGGALPEKWIVRTVDGRELEFKMLRELQAAITQARITRDDVISRGSSRPRRLGSIAELEPFFASPGSVLMSGTVAGIGPSAVQARSRTLTPQGLGGPAPGTTDASVAIPLPRPNDGDVPPDSMSDSETVVMDARPGHAPRARPSQRRGFVPPSSEPETGSAGRTPFVPGELPGVVVPPGEAPPLPDGFAGRRPAPRSGAASGASLRHGAPRGGADGAADSKTLPAGVQPLAASAEPPPRVEIRSAASLLEDDDAVTRRGASPGRAGGGERPARRLNPRQQPSMGGRQQDARSSYFDEGYGEPRFTSPAPSRRTGVARWIVGLVAVGLAALALATLGSKYLRPATPPRVVTTDARVPALLDEGERSLSDGDLETARDKFIKASALAENDPRVAEGLARLETVSADMRWLRLQLLPTDDPERDATKEELELAVSRARTAVEHAQRVAPSDAAAARTAIDLLRIQGDLAGARKLVGSISSTSAQPENALTLAALDLAELQPSWAAVIERLRTAASSEKNLGRARALLIYALARSGDIAGAKSEHERLVGMSRPHPLVRVLRTYIDRVEKASHKPPESGGATPVDARAVSAREAAEKAPRVPRLDNDDGRIPDDYVAPGGAIDTSDLPGIHPPSRAPEPESSASPKAPPGGDGSNLPGVKHD